MLAALLAGALLVIGFLGALTWGLLMEQDTPGDPANPPPGSMACPRAPTAQGVHGDGYVEVSLSAEWSAFEDERAWPAWMECGGLAEYLPAQGWGFFAVGQLSDDYTGELAEIAEEVLADELASGGVPILGETQARAVTVFGHSAWQIDAVGHESPGETEANWGDAMRVLVIDHAGERPTVVTVQVSGSDAPAWATVDEAFAHIRVP